MAAPERRPGALGRRARRALRSGIHACRLSDLPFWVGRILWEIELDGEIVGHHSKVAAARGRLLHRVEPWDDPLRDEYTRMCADRAHELVNSVSPPLEAWDAVVEPSVREGPALLGFVAARIAEEISGPEAYHAERARQTAWLVERLRLEA